MTETIDMRRIEPLPSGSYRVRLQVRKRPIRGTYASLAAAIEVRDAALREIADERFELLDGSSIAVLSDTFLVSLKGHRSYKTTKQRWTRHVLGSALAGMNVETIRTRDVLDWLDELKAKDTAYDPKVHGKRTAKPLSWQTRKHCLNHLRAFFKWAVKRDIVAANPCVEVAVEREDGDEDEGYQDTWYLDAGEQSKLLELSAHHGGAERHIVAFAIGTGLRLGELLCLHLVDLHVDVAEPYVDVRYGSWDRKRKDYRPPKGRRGEKKIRRVPLFGLGLDAAKAWLAVLPSYCKRNPLGLVFPTPRGARRDKAPRSWKPTVDAFGVMPRMKRKPWWHLLRHTCASSLVAGWWGRRWALEDASKLLGHSSVKVTERYAHLVPSVVQGTATAAQAAWLSSCHEAATNDEKPDEYPRNQRPSKPLVAGSNPAGRASTYTDRRGSCVAAARRALEAVAASEPTALRMCVDAIGGLLAELDTVAARRGVAS